MSAPILNSLSLIPSVSPEVSQRIRSFGTEPLSLSTDVLPCLLLWASSFNTMSELVIPSSVKVIELCRREVFLVIEVKSLSGDKPFKALQKVLEERPLAAVQIIGFIFAVEALGQFNQVKPGAAPGDLGFDPLGLKPSDPETWEKVQLRELKNGRLAMLAIAGQLLTEFTTGNGVLEAWKLGAVNPFN